MARWSCLGERAQGDMGDTGEGGGHLRSAGSETGCHSDAIRYMGGLGSWGVTGTGQEVTQDDGEVWRGDTG